MAQLKRGATSPMSGMQYGSTYRSASYEEDFELEAVKKTEKKPGLRRLRISIPYSPRGRKAL